MNVLSLLLLMLCVLFAVSEDILTGPQNPYCNNLLCPRGKHHVACERSSSDIEKSCKIQKTQLVNMTAYSENILKAHNELRQSLASGRNMTLPRAARLVAMQWSDELATLATYNVRMCHPKHDECHNTPNFKNSGQNIIMFNMTRLVEDELMEKMYPQLISIAARTWWSEHNNSSNMMTAADVEHTPCTKKPNPPQPFRHFAVMAVENNTHVGCAGWRYEAKESTHFKLTCNYAENYMCGRPIYHFRAVGCLTGYNPQHRALCSKRETFA